MRMLLVSLLWVTVCTSCALAFPQVASRTGLFEYSVKEVLPSTRAVVTCYNDSGQAVWVSKNRTEEECKTNSFGPGKTVYVEQVGYAAHGGMRSWTYGNGLEGAATFNNRLQVGEMTLGSGGSVWKLVNEYTRPGMGNNGNVWKQRQTVPGKPVIVTAFGYDGVNRLTVAEEGSGNENDPACSSLDTAVLSIAGRWCQKYGYDVFGDRLVTQRAGVGQGTSGQNPGGFNSATNRITGTNWEYNTLGDLVSDGDGRKYVYDAEGRMTLSCAASVALENCKEDASPRSRSSSMCMTATGSVRRLVNE